MPLPDIRSFAILADLATSNVLADYATREQPFFWRGETVALRVLCAKNGVALDLTNLTKIVLELKPEDDRNAAPLIKKEVLVASMDPDATLANFIAGTGQHVTFSLSSEDTAIDLGGEMDGRFWMVIYGVQTGTPDTVVTYSAGQASVVDDGVPSNQTGPSLADFVVIGAGDPDQYNVADNATHVFHAVIAHDSPVMINLPASPTDGRTIYIAYEANGYDSTIVDGGAKTLWPTGLTSMSLEAAGRWYCFVYSSELGYWIVT